MPVKNEEWILEYNLTCAEKFFDHIIVADQNSTDNTATICSKFSKVILIKNDQPTYNEGERRQLLLNAARSFDGKNFIANLAADEVFSANILEDDIFERLISGVNYGTAFSFQWVQLWRSTNKYRDDKSVWSNLYRPFAFIDDRSTNYEPGFAHLSIVPEAYMRDAVRNDEIKVLHFQFVDFNRMLAKQRWARLLEFGKYTQPKILRSLILNNKYYITKDERNIRLNTVPEEWFRTYPVFESKSQLSPWHIDASTSFINEYGADNLHWLDIWDYSWDNIPDKRNPLQKFYHNHQDWIKIINEITPKSLKEIIKKI